jgi:hypothetical protein
MSGPRAPMIGNGRSYQSDAATPNPIGHETPVELSGQ